MAHQADLFRITTRSLVLAYEEKHRIKGLTIKFSEIFNGKITSATRSISEIGGNIESIGHVYLRFREKDIDEEELASEAFQKPKAGTYGIRDNVFRL
jgi:hypothetical protein